MQRNTKQTSEFLCATTTLLVSTTLNATGIPPIDITLSSGAGSNIITTAAGLTSVVEYRIQDVIGKLPARTWVWATPIPPYLTRINSLHQPDCSIYNQNPANPNAFTLPPNGFCYFSMQVDGTKFASIYHGTAVTYRPMFTNSNAVAYGPCDSLNISLTTTTPLLIGAGGYSDTSGDGRPLLVQSQDEGTTWTYPQVINTPSYPDFPTILGNSFQGASCSGSTCIAVGTGEDDGLSRPIPILAQTQNGGNSWSYPPIIPPVFTPTNTNPYGSSGGAFFSASCSGNTCIASGIYSDTNGLERPLLAVTQNNGTTWTFPESVTAPVFTPGDTNPYSNNGKLNSASCSGSTCIAAGDYTDTSSTQRPLLVLSQNSGTSWTYPDSITSPSFLVNPFNGDGFFSGASCSGSVCIAAGAYISTNQQPLVAVSQNSGTSWFYPESVTMPIFSPANTFPYTQAGFFNSASCSGTTCVAVGQYTDISSVIRPLLAVSQNSGTSWSYPTSITAPVLTNTFNNGSLASVSCFATTCVAVGQYTDNSSVRRPLMAISQNSGTTWTYVDSITAPVLPTHPFNNGSFASVTCSGTKCIATGAYNSDTERPLLALSQNSGVTWTFIDSITSPVFTPVDTNPFGPGGGGFATSAIGAILNYAPAWMRPIARAQQHH